MITFLILFHVYSAAWVTAALPSRWVPQTVAAPFLHTPIAIDHARTAARAIRRIVDRMPLRAARQAGMAEPSDDYGSRKVHFWGTVRGLVASRDRGIAPRAEEASGLGDL